ncbi:holin, partial [Lactobacillus salivarius]|uniref:GH25 family lysozyme n=1 Tax=Ligilactobacillus salivarius TaxID=1624 RepID=UPI001406DA2B
MNIWEWIDKLTKGLQKLNRRITVIESVLFDDKINSDTPKPQHIGKIVDVSEWQGIIDWPSVIADDVTLSIIRVQHGSAHQDLKYMENLQQCISAGGKYAVYAYFAATSTSDAQQEA